MFIINKLVTLLEVPLRTNYLLQKVKDRKHIMEFAALKISNQYFFLGSKVRCKNISLIVQQIITRHNHKYKI